MSLSDEEQRALDEIEHTLNLDSSSLMSSLRGARTHDGWTTGSASGGQLLADVSLLLTGLTVLLIGVHANSGVGTAVGVIGYVVVVVSVRAMLSTLRRKRVARRTL
jgi:Protein of unknown function (DUF3040)